MTTDRNFIEYVTDQIDDGCDITWRLMFGGCTVYSKGKVVALICDDQLFVKPTEAGRAYIGDVVEAPPYPGAKNSFLIEDKIEDGDWLSELIALTERELPMPKTKEEAKEEVG